MFCSNRQDIKNKCYSESSQENAKKQVVTELLKTITQNDSENSATLRKLSKIYSFRKTTDNYANNTK